MIMDKQYYTANVLFTSLHVMLIMSILSHMINNPCFVKAGQVQVSFPALTIYYG